MNNRLSLFNKMFLVITLICFVFSFALMVQAAPLAPTVVLTTYASNFSGDVPIKVTASQNITVANATYITLVDTTVPTVNIPIVVRAYGNAITVTPKTKLAVDKDYNLKFDVGAIADATDKTVLLAASQTFSFNTDKLDFTTVMSSGLANLLQTVNGGFAASEIKVFSAKKYISSVNILYRAAGQVGTSGPSLPALTTLDIITGVGVSRVDVIPTGVATRTAKKNSTNSFSISYVSTALPVDYTLKAYDLNGVLAETKIIKVASTVVSGTAQKENYRYYTVGKGFTLAELLAKPATFQKLLDENALTDLWIQIAER